MRKHGKLTFKLSHEQNGRLVVRHDEIRLFDVPKAKEEKEFVVGDGARCGGRKSERTQTRRSERQEVAH